MGNIAENIDKSLKKHGLNNITAGFIGGFAAMFAFVGLKQSLFGTSETRLGGLIGDLLLPLAVMVGVGTTLRNNGVGDMVADYLDDPLTRHKLNDGRTRFGVKEGRDFTFSEIEEVKELMSEQDKPKLDFDDANNAVTFDKNFEIPLTVISELKQAAKT